MTLSAIDAFVEDGDPCVVVQCDCGERVIVFGSLDAERAIDQAAELHLCPRCAHCGEPMTVSAALSDEPNAIPIHQSCYLDDAPGVRQSIMAFLEAQEVAS